MLTTETVGQTLEISLNKILSEYCFASPDAIEARLHFENANYGYENFRKGFLPSVAFSLSPASFNHSYRTLQSPTDGSYAYIDDFSNNSSMGISVSQKVGITGGVINISSNLNMLNEFYDGRKSFSARPFSIGYSQKLFSGATAEFKLTKSVEEKKNEKAAKDYCNRITDIQREAIRHFMDLVVVKVGMDIALKNEAVSDTLLQASTVKFENGRMAEHEYLQMKLQAVNDRYTAENYKKEYEICMRRLLDYFGITDNYDNYLVHIPEFDFPAMLDFYTVMEHAEKNNPFVLNQQIKRIEAERNIHNAKFQNRMTGNINFNLGTNQYAPVLPNAFKNLASQQSLTVGLQIPVFQWGINKNNYKIAQNNYELSKLDIERENMGFYNDVKEQVNNYNHNVNLMTIAESSFELSVMQYESSVSKFNLGKLSIYELGLSQKEVFSAMNRYYSTMKEVWDGYYSLRRLTLFDFVANRELTDFLNE